MLVARNAATMQKAHEHIEVRLKVVASACCFKFHLANAAKVMVTTECLMTLLIHMLFSFLIQVPGNVAKVNHGDPVPLEYVLDLRWRLQKFFDVEIKTEHQIVQFQVVVNKSCRVYLLIYNKKLYSKIIHFLL